MKKTITINISGIIFHIEEDAYSALQTYLNDIVRYFSTYEDSAEIVQDIESRIAEILTAKLSAGKQAITAEDVRAMVKTMGTPSDFAAAESEDTETGDSSAAPKPGYGEDGKRLFRKTSNKMLGGVCSGIAHYLKADPMWLRLLFVLFFFGFAFLPAIPGFILLSYIVLWIVVPANDGLENQQVKTFFRDGSNKTLAGVASGLATYFAVDVVLIRLTFVLLFFLGGSGLIAYLILWFITPEAKTISDKIKMQGKPVTLSSIEENVKSNLKVDPEKEENLLTKIILFPFRVLSTIFSKGGEALGPIVLFIFNFIRIAAGLFFILVSTIIISALVLVLLVYTGIINQSEYLQLGGLSIDVIRNTIPEYMPLAAFTMVIIPLLSFLFLGTRMLVKKRFIPVAVSLGLLIVWVVSVFATAILAVPFVREFHEKEFVTVEKTLPVNGETIMIDLNRNTGETDHDDFLTVNLQIVGYEGEEVMLAQVFGAYGRTEDEAEANAKSMLYEFKAIDSSIVFDQYLQFAKDGKLRGQVLKNRLYMPWGQKFVLKKNISRVIRNTMTPYGYSSRDVKAENTWSYTEDGLQCLTCETTGERKPALKGKSISMSKFDKVEANKFFNLEIVNGPVHNMEILEEDDIADKVKMKISDKKLILNLESGWSWRDNIQPVTVRVTMPEVREVDLAGLSSATIRGFDGAMIKVSVAGAGRVDLDSDFEKVKLDLSGSSEAYLKGSGNKLEAELAGVCKLEAFEWQATTVKVSALGASKVKVNASEELKLRATGASNIQYKGDAADITANQSGIAKIERVD